MTRRRGRARALAALAITLVGAACGGDGDGDAVDGDEASASAFRVGRFDFDESRLLAELYAQSLAAVGVPVRLVEAAGPREIMAPALEQGQVDMLPEYLGTATRFFAATTPVGDDDSRTLGSLLEPSGLTALSPAPAQNVNAFAVRSDSGLGPALSDLVGVAPTLVFGGPPECRDRPLCLVGLADTYGLTFAEFVAQPSLAATAEALRLGEIDVGVMFSTSAELGDGLVVLDDDLALQPAENIVPVIRLDALESWGDARLRTTLDAVSAALTTADLRELNRRVDGGEPPADVAAAWLASQGLDGEG